MFIVFSQLFPVIIPEHTPEDPLHDKRLEHLIQKSIQKQHRNRTTFSTNQLEVLKTFYEKTSLPTMEMKDQMSRITGLPFRTIQVWFKNRRRLDRKNLC